MATIDPISITGLRDLQAALKAMDGETQKQLRVVFNQAAQAVVAGASRRVPVSTRRKGKKQAPAGSARRSVRATSSQREAKVSGGSAKVPYYGWLDFGGTVGRGRTGLGGVASAAGRSNRGTAGAVKRPFIERGRYIYPAYDANREAIGKALQKSIVDLCRNAGLEVDGG